MARRPRLFGERLYHHIYAWGNDRHPVFKDESHYGKYLAYLEHYSLRYKIDVIAYALMAWHLHLFIYDKQGMLSLFMNNVHGEYAQFFNRVTKRVGHVFGERFNNKIVQLNNYGRWLSRYIHRQPLEAGLVQDPKDYHWSSYRAFVGLVPKGFLKPEVILEQFGQDKKTYINYEAFVLGTDEDPINWQSQSASIVGDEGFVERYKELRELEKSDKETALNDKELIEILSTRLKVKPALLLNPSGLQERRIRHRAFEILVSEFRLPVRRLARLFNVSAMAAAKALKNRR